MRKNKLNFFIELDELVKTLVPNNKFFVSALVKEFSSPEKKTNILYYGTFREETTVFNSLISEEPILIDTTPTLFSHIAPDQISYFQGIEILFQIPIFELVDNEPVMLPDFDKFHLTEFTGSNGDNEIYFNTLKTIDDSYVIVQGFSNGVWSEITRKNNPFPANVYNWYYIEDQDGHEINCNNVEKFRFVDLQNHLLSNTILNPFFIPIIEPIKEITFDFYVESQKFNFNSSYNLPSNFCLQKSLDLGLTWVDFEIPQVNEYDINILSSVVQPTILFAIPEKQGKWISIYDKINLVRSNILQYGDIQNQNPVTTISNFETDLNQFQYNHGLNSYVDYIDVNGIQQRKFISFLAGFEEVEYISIIQLVNCHIM